MADARRAALRAGGVPAALARHRHAHAHALARGRDHGGQAQGRGPHASGATRAVRAQDAPEGRARREEEEGGERVAAALAHEVQHALEQAHPQLEVEIVRVAGSGDHVHDAPPRNAGFTSELDRALAGGKIDAALHDLPDVPRVRPDVVILGAVPRRRHPFDVLLTRDGRILDELEGGDRVAASSAARRAQVMAYREDLRAVPARGNLDTHLQQLENGDFEGLVMAATDAERLGWHDRVSEIFTTEVCVPEVGQGALA
ncbi:MAG: hydroxymethylbilane synthase, partial [Candidatus Eisenbacteria bacterium]